MCWKLAQPYLCQRQMVQDGQLHPNSLQEAKIDDYRTSMRSILLLNLYYAATTKCSSRIVLIRRTKMKLPAHVSSQLGAKLPQRRNSYLQWNSAVYQAFHGYAIIVLSSRSWRLRSQTRWSRSLGSQTRWSRRLWSQRSLWFTGWRY
jgi:hypothetical protein